MASGPINLDSMLGSRATVSISPAETDAETASRLIIQEKKEWHDRLKSTSLFFIIVVSVFIVAGLLVYEMLFDMTASPETKRWAQNGISTLFAGCISFLLGQASAKKAK